MIFYNMKKQLLKKNTRRCGNIMNAYEIKVLEKWMKQIKSGELNPTVLGYDADPEKAIKMIQNQLNNNKMK